MTEPERIDSAPGLGARSGAIGIPIVLLAAATWATSPVFIKQLGNDSHFTALALAFWRDLSTFLVLLAGLAVLRPASLKVRRQDLALLAAMGISLGTFHVFWNMAVFLNGAAVATVQQAAMPAIVAVAAWLLWHESLGRFMVLAILLTFAGTVLVSAVFAEGSLALSWRGVLIGLLVPLLYATWNLLGKEARGRMHPFTILTYAFGFAALILLPLQFTTAQPWPLPTEAWFWFTGLIAVSTITGFGLYTYALGILPASVASILAMSEILFVALYAYVLLGERLAASQLAGAALVASGVLVLSLQRLKMSRGTSNKVSDADRISGG